MSEPVAAGRPSSRRLAILAAVLLAVTLGTALVALNALEEARSREPILAAQVVAAGWSDAEQLYVTVRREVRPGHSGRSLHPSQPIPFIRYARTGSRVLHVAQANTAPSPPEGEVTIHARLEEPCKLPVTLGLTISEVRVLPWWKALLTGSMGGHSTAVHYRLVPAELPAPPPPTSLTKPPSLKQ